MKCTFSQDKSLVLVRVARGEAKSNVVFFIAYAQQAPAFHVGFWRRQSTCRLLTGCMIDGVCDCWMERRSRGKPRQQIAFEDKDIVQDCTANPEDRKSTRLNSS